MNAEEIKEGAEHAHGKGEKAIGLTMAITAVLLATATLLSHREHTEEVVLKGISNDQWAFYQAKHIRYRLYGPTIDLAALLPNGQGTITKYQKLALEEECGKPAEAQCKNRVQQELAVAGAAAEKPASEAQDDKKAAKDNAVPHEGAGAKESVGQPAEHDPVCEIEVPSKDHKTAKPAVEFKEGAIHIQKRARRCDAETEEAKDRAKLFDTSELFLEISIVLCSISLLADSKYYWRASFITTAVGIVISLYGYFMPTLPHWLVLH